MIFDTMCRLAEKANMEALCSRLRYTSLLMLGESHNAGWDGPSAVELFRLPWKSVALEDSMSCVLLERIGKTDLGKTIGWLGDGPTKFAIAAQNQTDSRLRSTTADVGLEVGDTFSMAMAQRGSGESSGVHILQQATCAFAGVHAETMNHSWSFGWVDTFVEGRGRTVRKTFQLGDHGYFEVTQELTKQLIVATWQCVMATQPGSWVLQKIGGEHRRSDSPKIPRSHQRPTWIVITDAERKRCFRDRDGDEGGRITARHVSPHPRRAHYRHIGDNEDGTRRYTWVRACWVGSVEAEIRGSRYKVELEI